MEDIRVYIQEKLTASDLEFCSSIYKQFSDHCSGKTARSEYVMLL